MNIHMLALAITVTGIVVSFVIHYFAETKETIGGSWKKVKAGALNSARIFMVSYVLWLLFMLWCLGLGVIK